MAHSDSEHGEGVSQSLTSDIFSDIFSRVDGVTLARLSSVSTQFRTAALEEAHWERLCNKRWPSTTQPSVKALIFAAGGFLKFYSRCYPFATPRHHQNEYDHELSASANDFVSLVDVLYDGVPVVSRVIDGINGAEALCGPLVDVVDTTWEGDHGVRMNLEEDGEQVVPIDRKSFQAASGTNRHRLWRALRKRMRVSWILIHKTTRRMVNLASWEALSAMRHCGYGDDDVILCFGSVLPSSTSAPVVCNIIMRCKMVDLEEGTVVKVTELGCTLEHGDSARLLRRQEAVNVLHCALSCVKTIDYSEVATTYCKLVAAQMTNREALIRWENRRQTFVAICLVGAIVIFLASFCFKARL